MNRINRKRGCSATVLGNSRQSGELPLTVDPNASKGTARREWRRSQFCGGSRWIQWRGGQRSVMGFLIAAPAPLIKTEGAEVAGKQWRGTVRSLQPAGAATLDYFAISFIRAVSLRTSSGWLFQRFDCSERSAERL